MKYLIRGELELKICGGLFSELCDFHIGAILTDNSMDLLTGPIGLLPSLGFPQLLPAATHFDWWRK